MDENAVVKSDDIKGMLFNKFSKLLQTLSSLTYCVNKHFNESVVLLFKKKTFITTIESISNPWHVKHF